jgi:hypothetical protein
MSRTQFYEFKRRFQTHGFEGLKDLPPIHKSHPQTTPKETVERILELSLMHPAWGCSRISALLKLEGNEFDGVPAIDVFDPRTLPQPVRKVQGLYRRVEDLYKQLNAPVGR